MSYNTSNIIQHKMNEAYARGIAFMKANILQELIEAIQEGESQQGIRRLINAGKFTKEELSEMYVGVNIKMREEISKLLNQKDESAKQKQNKVKAINKVGKSGLTRRKKEILREKMGSASEKVDLNKIREWAKYGDSRDEGQ